MNSWIALLKNKLVRASVKKAKSGSVDIEVYQSKVQQIRSYLLSERFEEALSLTHDLISIEFNEPELWELLGCCLERKDAEEAEICYLRALELKPDRVDSYLGLGIVNILLNKPSKAMGFLEKAALLNANNVKVWINLADLYLNFKRPQDALLAYDKALMLKPSDAKLLCNKGVCLAELNQFEDSEQAFKKTLELNPDYEKAYFQFGSMYRDSKNYDKAKEIFKQLIAINPKNPSGYLGLAGVEFIENLLEDAYATQKLGLEICDTESIDAHRQMMHFCSNFYGKDKEVAYHLNKLEELAPDTSHLNYAVYFLREHKFAEALTILELFKQQNPLDTISEANKALTLLLLGFYKEGWVAYEVRKVEKLLSDSSLNTSRQIPLPFWDGTPIHDKSLVVVTEQGVGDSIHFVRYLPLLKMYTNKVILTCNPNVERLFSSIPGISIARSVEDVINADFQVLLLSLPMIFKTELSTIPAKVPYLNAPPELIDSWKTRLQPWKNHLKVGLVWAGGAVFKGDFNRSIKLAQFAPVFEVKNITFFSLQMGPQSAQITEKPPGAELIDFTEYITDFADTAAFVSQLDLVISVDTSVAHLAGALAVPVWILLPFFPDHRWFLGREDNPWYPTARLFRQGRARRWDEVLGKMAGALAKIQNVDASEQHQAFSAPLRNLLLEAEQCLEQGRIAYAEGHYESAKDAFERAIILKPDLVDAWYNLGLANQLLDKPAIARVCYKRAIVLNPADAGAYHNLACIAADYKDDQEAIEYFEKSWQLDSTNPEVAYNYARLLWQTFDIKKGLQIQGAGLDIDPQHRLGWINYALLLAESNAAVEAAVALKNGLGCPILQDDELIAEEAEMLFSLGDLESSLKAAQLAESLNPNNIKAKVGQGFIFLKQGKLLDGWKLLEHRLEAGSQIQEKYIAEIWDGRDMPDATLLVHGEQGFGDMIQCMRYLPLLKSKFKKVVVHFPKQLFALAKMVIGAEIMKVEWDEVPEHDIRIPVMSIPLRFNTLIDSIPNTVPYFNTHQDYLVKWAGLTGKNTTKRRIGLAWAGGTKLASNQRRSIPLELLAPLLISKNIEWWSLQKDYPETFPDNIRLIDKMHFSANMADTAALILQLDLVITVDTVIAHLAGSLGKPVWVLLAFDSDYRWLMDREDSPWYPTARLFRQDIRRSWSPVIERLLAAVDEWMSV